MEMLDQKIALPGSLAQKCADFFLGAKIDLPPLGNGSRALAPPAGVLEVLDLCFVTVTFAHAAILLRHQENTSDWAKPRVSRMEITPNWHRRLAVPV